MKLLNLKFIGAGMATSSISGAGVGASRLTVLRNLIVFIFIYGLVGKAVWLIAHYRR